jgi:hypothetical protein
MRKSIIAGLTLSAALAVSAGLAQAAHDTDKDGAPRAGRAHAHKQVRHIAETPVPPPVTQFRIPAHPVIRDCVHVMFPQCGRGYDGLNDGQFNRPY